MRCPECGTPLRPGLSVCPACGELNLDMIGLIRGQPTYPELTNDEAEGLAVPGMLIGTTVEVPKSAQLLDALGKSRLSDALLQALALALGLSFLFILRYPQDLYVALGLSLPLFGLTFLLLFALKGQQEDSERYYYKTTGEIRYLVGWDGTRSIRIAGDVELSFPKMGDYNPDEATRTALESASFGIVEHSKWTKTVLRITDEDGRVLYKDKKLTGP